MVRKDSAEQLVRMFYRDGEKPSAEFLHDLESLIDQSKTYEEIRDRIVQRHSEASGL